jgi:hypothetical protein
MFYTLNSVNAIQNFTERPHDVPADTLVFANRAEFRAWGKNEAIERLQALDKQVNGSDPGEKFFRLKVVDAIWAGMSKPEVAAPPAKKKASPKPAAKKAPPKKGAKAKTAKIVKPGKTERKKRDGGTLAKIEGLLRRNSGASVGEIMKEMGYSATHSARGRVSNLRTNGLKVTTEKHPKRGLVYHAA